VIFQKVYIQQIILKNVLANLFALKGYSLSLALSLIVSILNIIGASANLSKTTNTNGSNSI
jgi:hypothetical protein